MSLFDNIILNITEYFVYKIIYKQRALEIATLSNYNHLLP